MQLNERDNVRIMGCNFDFNRMLVSTTEDTYQLVVVSDKLHYKSLGLDCPKLVANTGNKIFDDSVTRTWESFIFERDVLNSK